jgi:hypothetical protein
VGSQVVGVASGLERIHHFCLSKRMKSDEMIRFAEHLSRNSNFSAAASSSIISRHYYGVFLVVREGELRRRGFRIRSRGNRAFLAAANSLGIPLYPHKR